MTNRQIEENIWVDELRSRLDRLCLKHEFKVTKQSTSGDYQIILMEYSEKREGFDDRTIDNMQRIGTIMDLDLKKRLIELWVSSIEYETKPEPKPKTEPGLDVAERLNDERIEQAENESHAEAIEEINDEAERKQEITPEELKAFIMRTKEARDIKPVFKAIETLVDEATLIIGPEGLSFRGMDPSHIALIDINIPNHAFETFEVDQENKIGVRVDELTKVLADFDDKESLKISVSEDLMLVLKSGDGRTVKNRLIESSASMTPLPKLNYDAKITLDCKTFEKIIKSVAKVSEYITIATPTNSKVSFSGRGDSGEIDMNVESGYPGLEDISLKAESKSTYSIDYIKKLHSTLKAAAETVTLEYSTKMPLRLTYTIMNTGKVHYYLAPRVQD